MWGGRLRSDLAAPICVISEKSLYLPFVGGVWDEDGPEMEFLNHCSWKGKAADCLLPLRGTCFTKLPLALCSEGPGVPGAVSGQTWGV